MGAGDGTASPCTECQQISVKAIMKFVRHWLVIMISDKSGQVAECLARKRIFAESQSISPQDNTS